ncbi:MAG: TonB-dependent receptor, partial [Sphingomicrobium sp.]
SAEMVAVQAPARTSSDPQVRPDETIIVTARRREEYLQRTPISVISLKSSDLDGHTITNLRDLPRLVPNLTLSPSQNVGDAAANIFIRGIGQEDFAAGTDPGVGIYVDGIYIGRSMGALLDLLDVARVEVLRGPQGTLYGRNTIGGAINVISTPPIAATSAAASVSATSLGAAQINTMFNTILSDRLLARFAVSGASKAGFVQRVLSIRPNALNELDASSEGEEQRLSARLQLRFEPGGGWIVDASADSSRRRGTQSPTHVDAVDPTANPAINALIRQGLLPGPEFSNALVSPNLLISGAGGGNRIAQDISGVALSLANTFGQQTLRMIVAKRWLRSDVATDLDGTALNIFTSRFRERSDQFSAELQSTGRLAGVIYTAGLFALREAGALLPVPGGQDVAYQCNCLYTPATRPLTNFPARQVRSNSYAGYVQSTIEFRPNLSATIGARYSIERKWIAGQLIRLDPDTLQPTSLVVAAGTNQHSWNSLTWRAGLEYQLHRDVMVYASAARGFKSGGFNVRPAGRLPNLGLAAYAPETALTYETGLRSEWLARRFQLNLTAFLTDYRDIQLRRQIVIVGNATTLIDNAARARISGLEAELKGRLTNQLTVALNYGHLSPRFLDVGTAADVTLGSTFQRSPHDSFSLLFDYERAAPWGRIGLHADYAFRSAEQFQIVASPWDQPAFGLLGAHLVFSGKQERWSLGLFGSNLTNVVYRTAGRASLLTQLGVAYSTVGRPREIGLDSKFNF